jgi:hypothetical protein
VETVQAQAPPEISTFEAKNKTWGHYLHPVVEFSLKTDSDIKKVEFWKISV